MVISSREVYGKQTFRTALSIMSTSVIKVNTRGIPFIVLCQIDCLVNRLQHVRLDQIPLAKYSDTSPVSVQQISMLCKLKELDLCHFHKRIDLVLGPLEVLDAERVNGHHLDAGFVADFENLQVVSEVVHSQLYSLVRTLATASKPRLCPSTVSI